MKAFSIMRKTRSKLKQGRELIYLCFEPMIKLCVDELKDYGEINIFNKITYFLLFATSSNAISFS